jgi:photosystem II stability/assembly factor-like uncharacterized protein
MTYELLVSTRKGLVIGRSEDRARWEFGDTHFPGWQIDYAVRDPRTNRLLVAASHDQWGPHLHRSDDDGATWDEAPAPEFHGETYSHSDWDSETESWAERQTFPASLERIWTIQPGPDVAPGVIYAGVDPAALFISSDDGESWELCRSLWEHETRNMWVPGAAGMTLHHIQVASDDPSHLYVGISAAGVFESRDGGASWIARNRGCIAEHLPDPEPEAGQCVHSLHLHPLRPERLFQQHHPGVYRSDDGGQQWVAIHEGLPGDFGFASTIDPADPDVFYVIPLQFDQARIPAGGDLRVYRTSDAGASWEPLGNGLPDGHVLQGVYRQSLCNDGVTEADQLGLYLGTSGGHVYASSNGGEQWSELIGHLAPITALRCSMA